MSEKAYAVFLSFNSEDRAAVEQIAVYLHDKAKLRPWFDQWELIPGESWVRNMERGLDAADTCAVFVGQSGQGTWQQRQVEAALRYHVENREFRVIPVLLPNAPEQPKLPIFLAGNEWVDFRGISLTDDNALWRLECGIRGVAPGRGRLFSQTPTAEQQKDLERKIELLRQENLQKEKNRQTAQRKSVGTKPYVERLFVDRVAYLEKLTEYACCDEAHLIVIVGQGGIGKTALTSKFCDDIEKAGYIIPLRRDAADSPLRRAGLLHPVIARSVSDKAIPDSNEMASSLSLLAMTPVGENATALLPKGGFAAAASKIRAIVYVSKNEMAAFTLEQVFGKLAQTLDTEDAARLEPLLKDPQADAALKTEKLLDCLRGDTTLLVLDNFETVLAEQAITHAELDIFLRTVCATQHSLKVIITSRYEVNLKTFGVGKKIVLNEGLRIEDAVDFLRRLGHDVPQIQQASDAELRQLALKVHGVPMALRSLAGFLVEREQRRLTVAALLADQSRFEAFKKHDFKEGLRKLIDEQWRILPEAAQLALQAMAVYNAPIKPVAAQYLFPALDAEAALDDLAYSYFLAQHNRLTDQFELHPSVQEYAYEQIALTPTLSHKAREQRTPHPQPLPNREGSSLLSFGEGAGGEVLNSGRSKLHARAADFYAELKKPKSEWKRLADVQPHLDEIEQRLKAGDYDRAAQVLDEIDFDYLQLWGYSLLIVGLREQLVGKLMDKGLIQANYGYLGHAYRTIGRVQDAIPCYEQALENARKEKNRWGEDAWLGNLGIAYAESGEPMRAIESYTQALEIAREIGDKHGEGVRLGCLGIAHYNLGDLVQAINYYKQAIAISIEISDNRNEGIHTGNLGEAYWDIYIQHGNETYLQEAISAHQRALEIGEEIGSIDFICFCLNCLGTDYLFVANMKQATEYFQRCIAACDQALAQSPLYEVFYYRAFALLALAVIDPPQPLPSTGSGHCPEGEVYEQAYRKAIEVNAAAGVLRENIHEVERLQQIVRQKRLATPEALHATETVLRLLRT